MAFTVPDCVIFMLIKDNQLLVEKRKLTKLIDPGLIEIPGGHLEAGEDQETALWREIQEELAVGPGEASYVCTLLSQRFQKMHYYAVRNWVGTIQNNEAEALFWVLLNNLSALDLQMDKTAVQEYLRLYRPNKFPGTI